MAFRLVNREKLLRPNICLVCEHKPDERVVDTGFNLKRTTVTEILRGRKYICSRCGELIAKALGFPTVHQASTWKDEIIRLQNEIAALQDMLDLQAKLDAFIEANKNVRIYSAPTVED